MYWILDNYNNVCEYVETLSEAKELFEDYYNSEDYRIEKARNFYEVGLMKHVEGSVENDFETIEFVDVENYRDAVKSAKELSKEWDACNVCCYTWTDISSYEEVFKEQYIKGTGK